MYPNVDARHNTILAAGQTWFKTHHIRFNRRPGIRDSHIVEVLENWVVSGIRSDQEGRLTRHYFLLVADYDDYHILRLVTSMEHNRLITIHPDGDATVQWRAGNLAYFEERYQQLETRDAETNPQGLV